MLDSAGNSPEFLAEQLAGSKTLAFGFSELTEHIRTAQGYGVFEVIKADILQVFEELESNILRSPHTVRAIPNIMYNLSRYQDNGLFLQEALLNILVHVNGTEQRSTLKRLVRGYLEESRTPEHQGDRSGIMDALAHIIERQDRETPMSSLNGEKIEKIITSLLSSPYNYTPLFHFVILMDYQGMKVFLELWIDPKDEKSGEGSGDSKERIHVSISFGIPRVNQLEAEFKVVDRKASFSLFSPKNSKLMSDGLASKFRQIMKSHGYRAALVESKETGYVYSLMDVFEDLPYKRTGIDVKV